MTALCVLITIPGEPVPQGRAQAARWKAKDGRSGIALRDPKKSRSWKATAQTHMLIEMRRAGLEPLTGPVKLEIQAVFSCPRSEYRKRKPRQWRWSTRANGDADNLAKAVMDAGNGVLYLDDRQVVDLRVVKMIGAQGTPPMVEVRMVPLEGVEP